MDAEFNDIYQSLFQSYGHTTTITSRYPGNILAIARQVSKALEQIQGDLERSNSPVLREDAKYFILLCLIEMIYIPLSREAAGTLGNR